MPAEPTAAHDAERRTRAVALLTLATMAAEIAAGWWFNSMALLADGWHMGTHAAAIGLAALAYALARRWRHDKRFVFGPWKVEILAAFASALALLAAAAGIAWASLARVLEPTPIRYEEAIAVAVLGLAVNLLSAWLLRHRPHGHEHGHGHGRGHGHGHAHGHDHGRAAGHSDLNLRAAYLHVLVDALTSALAIAALGLGLWLGWGLLDPLIGLVGAALVARWGVTLMVDTARVLLDAEAGDAACSALQRRVVQGLEQALPSRMRCGSSTCGCGASAASAGPRPCAWRRQARTSRRRPCARCSRAGPSWRCWRWKSVPVRRCRRRARPGRASQGSKTGGVAPPRASAVTPAPHTDSAPGPQRACGGWPRSPQTPGPAAGLQWRRLALASARPAPR